MGSKNLKTIVVHGASKVEVMNEPMPEGANKGITTSREQLNES